MRGRALGLITAALLACHPAMAGTLDEVRERGALRCGVSELGSALSTLDEQGQWRGFYTEFCRAVAAAVTGDANHVDFLLISTVDRFDAIKSGAIDVVSETTTWNLQRDGDGINFAGIYLIDGQGFLTHANSGARTAEDLRGRKVCTPAQSTSEHNLAEFNITRGLGMEIIVFTTIQGAYAGFAGRQCDAMSTDAQILASMRHLLAPNPNDYILLEERISREPLGPLVREDDGGWEDVVRWTLLAMIAGEEAGITSANVDELRAGGSAEVRRFLGAADDIGGALGLDREWAYRVLKQIGNYGEVYERTIGAGLGMPRGANALLRDGGALWSPPFR